MCWRFWAARKAWPGWTTRRPPKGGGPDRRSILQCTRQYDTHFRGASGLSGRPHHLIGQARAGLHNDRIGDFTMDAKTDTTVKTATLTVGNKNYDFPILS